MPGRRNLRLQLRFSRREVDPQTLAYARVMAMMELGDLHGVRESVWVCVGAWVCASVRVCGCAWVCECVWVRGYASVRGCKCQSYTVCVGVWVCVCINIYGVCECV